VLCVAASYPDEFCATACFHGTRLVSDSPLSPHRLAERYRGEIYCGFGELDEHAPPQTAATLARAFAGRTNFTYRAIVHPGADHGYPLARPRRGRQARRRSRLGNHLRDVPAPL